jgi:outer membrane lipoprotein LolB
MVLAGCATLPERAPAANITAVWASRQQALTPVTAWEIRGRVALHTADDGWQASLRWRRDRDHHQLDLMGPLGRGHMRLTQTAQGAQLRDDEQRVYYADSAEQLLLRATGWQLPLAGLNYWVLGLPVPQSIGVQGLDAWGRLESLQQLGWDIHFLEYVQHGSFELPSKLFLKRLEPPPASLNPDTAVANGTLEVRLVIERWALNEALNKSILDFSEHGK